MSLTPPGPAPGRGHYDRALTREMRVASQHERLLHAVARAAATGECTVSRIIGLARVGRATFYEYFDDAEHALSQVVEHTTLAAQRALNAWLPDAPTRAAVRNEQLPPRPRPSHTSSTLHPSHDRRGFREAPNEAPSSTRTPPQQRMPSQIREPTRQVSKRASAHATTRSAHRDPTHRDPARMRLDERDRVSARDHDGATADTQRSLLEYTLTAHCAAWLDAVVQAPWSALAALNPGMDSLSAPARVLRDALLACLQENTTGAHSSYPALGANSTLEIHVTMVAAAAQAAAVELAREAVAQTPAPDARHPQSDESGNPVLDRQTRLRAGTPSDPSIARLLGRYACDIEIEALAKPRGSGGARR